MGCPRTAWDISLVTRGWLAGRLRYLAEAFVVDLRPPLEEDCDFRLVG